MNPIKRLTLLSLLLVFAIVVAGYCQETKTKSKNEKQSTRAGREKDKSDKEKDKTAKNDDSEKERSERSEKDQHHPVRRGR